MKVAIVHDYLTQKGGAERVVLSMLKAFPRAPLYTSLYDPEGTLPDFQHVDVRPLLLNRVPVLRRNHRLALPLLASAFSSLRVPADLTICSSSGWAHGVQVDGRKIVYCYSPARWLYDQANNYLGGTSPFFRGLLRTIQPSLRRWDSRAAHSADHYVVISTTIRDRVRDTYGIDPEVLLPPHTIDPTGPNEPVEALEPGFFLCISRLLPYKNVDSVIDAFKLLPRKRLVIVGTGPEHRRLAALAGPNVRFLGSVTDAHIRWLYSQCAALVAASYEDYGLTPLEAAAFGKPVAALRWGGFLDTVQEGLTGLFFDQPAARDIADTLGPLLDHPWNPQALRRHSRSFEEPEFVRRLQALTNRQGLAA